MAREPRLASSGGAGWVELEAVVGGEGPAMAGVFTEEVVVDEGADLQGEVEEGWQGLG